MSINSIVAEIDKIMAESDDECVAQQQQQIPPELLEPLQYVRISQSKRNPKKFTKERLAISILMLCTCFVVLRMKRTTWVIDKAPVTTVTWGGEGGSFTTTTTKRRGMNSNANASSFVVSGGGIDEVDVVDSDYALAYEQSFGFFNDIPESDWEKMRSIASSLRINEDGVGHWDPNFSCRFKQRVGDGRGGEGETSRWICDPHRLVEISRRRRRKKEVTEMIDRDERQTAAGCLVYSFAKNGGTQFQFEGGFFNLLGPNVCEVHAFRPVENASEKLATPPDVIFHRWGLGEKDNDEQDNGKEMNRNGSKRYTLKETTKILGHGGRVIDVFSVDCEGSELRKTFLDLMADSGGIVDIRQILITLHNTSSVTDDLFVNLHRWGYVVFHREMKMGYGGNFRVEYGLLKLHPKFSNTDSRF